MAENLTSDATTYEAHAVFRVPTYFGEIPARKAAGPGGDYGAPTVPVTVCPADELRILLGATDPGRRDVPDIHIERWPNGWAVFLYPAGGVDPCGVVYMHDDGRSWFKHEASAGLNNVPPRMQIVEQTPADINGAAPPVVLPAVPAAPSSAKVVKQVLQPFPGWKEAGYERPGWYVVDQATGMHIGSFPFEELAIRYLRECTGGFSLPAQIVRTYAARSGDGSYTDGYAYGARQAYHNREIGTIRSDACEEFVTGVYDGWLSGGRTFDLALIDRRLKEIKEQQR